MTRSPCWYTDAAPRRTQGSGAPDRATSLGRPGLPLAADLPLLLLESRHLDPVLELLGDAPTAEQSFVEPGTVLRSLRERRFDSRDVVRELRSLSKQIGESGHRAIDLVRGT